MIGMPGTQPSGLGVPAGGFVAAKECCTQGSRHTAGLATIQSHQIQRQPAIQFPHIRLGLQRAQMLFHGGDVTAGYRARQGLLQREAA